MNVFEQKLENIMTLAILNDKLKAFIVKIILKMQIK